MAENDNKHEEIDRLINGAFEQPIPNASLGLRERFEKRLMELQITSTQAQEILDVERRTLNGIIDGTQKRVDFIALSKLARFLVMPSDELVRLYLETLEKNYEEDVEASSKKKFIVENFDLVVLQKSGFIDSINDFVQIENQLVSFFGLRTIFEYEKEKVYAAFSEGLVKPKNMLTREFWINAAAKNFKEIENPNKYDREALMDYFPKIRWYSTDVEKGMLHVVRSLYRLGITVIFQPSLPTLHLRGATFAVDGNPCIVLTDYKGFYPTLWFALVHELYHVIFDWEEIKVNLYHLSDEHSDQPSVQEKEDEANNFSREYLFSNSKMAMVKPYLRIDSFVKEFAVKNHVHPSFIYTFSAFDNSKYDKTAWPRAQKHMPEINSCLRSLVNYSWDERKTITELVKRRKSEMFSSI
jgi:HTH-type transcriptional regulator / antitoxin HigA